MNNQFDLTCTIDTATPEKSATLEIDSSTKAREVIYESCKRFGFGAKDGFGLLVKYEQICKSLLNKGKQFQSKNKIKTNK